MKTLSKEQYEEIYRLLDRVSPLDTDCGKLCGAACCTQSYADGEEMGIFLMPGEEALFGPEDDAWLERTHESAEDLGFPASWVESVAFVHCKTPPVCPREKRPIQCRTYPLTPHLDAEGHLTLVYNDLDMPYRCPLIEEQIPLNDDFVEATLKAWDMLIQDPRVRDLVREDSIEREEAVNMLADMLGER